MHGRLLLQVTVHRSQVLVTVPPIYKQPEQYPFVLNQANTSSSMPGYIAQFFYISATQYTYKSRGFLIAQENKYLIYFFHFYFVSFAV